MKALWTWFFKTSNRFVFAAVLFFAGVIAWGAFNTAMEYTNTMDFCIGCHEMKDTVFAEYEGTVHYHNRSGVRAGCPDCHVPEEWGPKIVRKIKASKEVFGKITHKIDTPEKFEEHRLQMAKNVWSEMRENGSRECKNCHSYEAMHGEKQGSRAQQTMMNAAKADTACIDCHKGIAHKLPKFDKIYARWSEETQTAVQNNPASIGVAYAASDVKIMLEKDASSDVVATVKPLSSVEVVDQDGEWLKVKLSAWDREGGAKLYAKAGPQYEVAKLGGAGFDVVQQSDSWVDPDSELTWNKASVEGWVSTSAALTAEFDPLETYVTNMWDTDCGLCHTRYETTKYNAFDWGKKMKTMRRFTHLDQDQQALVLQYLQMNASDMVAAQ